MAKSTCKASPGAMCAAPPQVPTTRTYEGLGNGWVYVTNDGVNAQGMPTGNRFVARRDGRDYPNAARGQQAYATIAFTVKSTNPFSADWVAKANGVVTVRATETVSADGKTMTQVIHNFNPQGQPTVDLMQVWEKQ